MHPILEMLDQHLTRHPITEKILLAPSRKEGRRLTEALAASGRPVLNLRAETLSRLLETLNEAWLREEKRQVIPAEVSWFLTKQILSELQASHQLQYFQHMERSFGMITALQDAVKEMRSGGVLSAAIQPGTFITPEKSEDLKRILFAYEERLNRGQWADDLMLFQHLDLKKVPLNPSAHYLILPEEAPAPIYRQLTEALLQHPGVFLLTNPEEEKLPNHGTKATRHFIQSNGRWNETRDILRHLKIQQTPLDQVTLLTTGTEPYTGYLEGQARRFDIPVTFGNGISINRTGPGALFTTLIRWIRSNYQTRHLAAMVRNPWFQMPKDGMTSVEMERFLRESRIGWGKSRYREGLDPTDKTLQEILRRMEGLPDPTDPSAHPPARWIEALADWLYAFSNPRNKKDGEAREILLEQLYLSAAYATAEDGLKETLEHLEKRISGLRAGAASPEPGALHVDSLENSRFLSRPIAAVMGLDARSFPGLPKEGPVLLDTERDRIAGLPLKRNEPLLREKRVRQLEACFEGDLILSYSGFDPLEQRAESPSAFLLQAYRIQQQDSRLGYEDLRNNLKSGSGYLPLHPEEDLDLSETLLRRLYHESMKNPSAALDQYYPSIQKGRHAFVRRHEDGFNAYNGRINVRPEEVDPRQNHELTVSASQLEQLAKCPYVHFLQRLLGLYPLEEAEYHPETWLSAMERGSLLHAVYENFYREVAEQHAWQHRKEWPQILQTVLKKQLSRFRREVPPPGERIYQREAAELENAASFFLTLEDEYHHHQKPVYLELKLGLEEPHPVLGELPPAVFDLADGRQFRFRGAVDRIDEVVPLRYEVIDYKTGSTYGFSPNKPFDQGCRLQHGLYAQVVEKLLKNKVDPEARVLQSGYYFPTPKGQGEKIMYEARLNDGQPLHSILTLLLDAVASGTFIGWGDGYQRKQEDYRPIMDQNPDEAQIKEMLKETEDPELLKLLEVKNYE